RAYKLERVNLADLAGIVLESLESQFQHNQFVVSTKLAPNVPVLIDKEAAEQALENLLSNAMKYSPEHREILVEVDQVDQYGVVRVHERGIGIHSRRQPKLSYKCCRSQSDADA